MHDADPGPRLPGGDAGPAHAYLDPGTGGMLLQLLLGGFAAALVVLRLYWHSFKAWLSGNKPAPPPRDDGKE